MNNKDIVIAKKILKIARMLSAGGGAGVVFKINDCDMDMTFEIEGTPDNWKITKKEENLVINSFDANGYERGMNNVNGSLFNDVSVNEDDMKEIIQTLIDDNKDDEMFLEDLEDGMVVHFDFVEAYENVRGAGYIHMTMKNGDTVEFKALCEAYLDDYGKSEEFETTISAKATEEAEMWYSDVFENDPDEDTEEAWNDYFEYCHEKYHA